MKTEEKAFNKIPFENLGSTIEETFDIYKKTALINGLFLIIMGLFLAILTVVSMNFFFEAGDLAENLKSFKPDNFSTNQLLILIGISILINVLTIPFVAGMLKVNQEADSTGKSEFSTIYSLVNSPVYPQLVLGIIISTLFSSLLSYAPIFFEFDGILKMFFTICAYTFALLNFLTIPLIALKNYSFVDAIVASFKATSHNFVVILLMIILAIIVACAGIFALCIGFFFTAPVFYTVQYVLYKRIFEDTI